MLRRGALEDVQVLRDCHAFPAMRSLPSALTRSLGLRNSRVPANSVLNHNGASLPPVPIDAASISGQQRTMDRLQPIGYDVTAGLIHYSTSI